MSSVHSPGKYLFSYPRHGGRTKGTETAFPQILRSFLPDRVTLIRSIDFIVRRNARNSTGIIEIYFSKIFASSGNNIELSSSFFFYKRLRILLGKPDHPFESDWKIGRKKKLNRKKRFIDHRFLDGEKRYGLFRSYHSVRSLIGCTRLRGGGIVSRVGGGRYGWCMPYGQKRAAVDQIACSSSLLKPAHAYCLLICRWYNYLCNDHARERERGCI